VTPTGSELPFRPDVTRADRLLRAARPVLDRLADQLGGAAATVVLADADGWVIDRRAESRDLNKALDRVLVAPGFCYAEEHAGTNGIGSVLEAGGPIVVAGSEHFRDNLQDFTCVGAPHPQPFAGGDPRCARCDLPLRRHQRPDEAFRRGSRPRDRVEARGRRVEAARFLNALNLV
jgi:hypothetical protein